MLFRDTVQMRIAADFVCYSGSISVCKKGKIPPNGTGTFQENKPVQPPLDHAVTLVGPDAEHKAEARCLLLLRGPQCLGKLRHWNITLKLHEGTKECDGDVSNTIMDNTMFGACATDGQWSIELKMLVEHRERDNISFNSVTSACAVDKQLAEELTIFHSMGGKCAEKTHRSNSVLLNALRRRPVAVSVLQQAETGRAVEQELFQSEHVSVLEPSAIPKSARLSYEEVNEGNGKGQENLEQCLVLDSQKKPVLVRSILVVKQIRSASNREDVFAGAPTTCRDACWLFCLVHPEVVAIALECGICL